MTRTTLDLPDDLFRAIKVRAATEDRKLKDLIAELLRLGMALDRPHAVVTRRRVQLPLIHTAHSADPQDMSPERLAQILLDEEGAWALEA